MEKELNEQRTQPPPYERHLSTLPSATAESDPPQSGVTASSVGSSGVGEGVGSAVGAAVGADVGADVGAGEGSAVGSGVVGSGVGAGLRGSGGSARYPGPVRWPWKSRSKYQYVQPRNVGDSQ